jgi:undecaprenyl-diphosphatase
MRCDIGRCDSAMVLRWRTDKRKRRVELGHLIEVVLLGLLEGLTEFIPVSSTGHLVLAGHFLDFRDPGGVFKIAIQLGAILAVLVAYWSRFWGVLTGLGARDPAAIRFTVAILLGFLPAMVIGVFAYEHIKALLENPAGVAWALLVGGVAILLIERLVKQPRFFEVQDFPAPLALKIGLVQCLAMIPGVSRSGATIMGALLMKVDRKAAAEYSFFLAVPTMAAATVYDLYKQRAALGADDLLSILIGFIVAFFAALLVVKSLVAFVSKHGFAPFAWYRIVVGGGALVLLYAGY